jgi:hypothetical protein
LSARRDVRGLPESEEVQKARIAVRDLEDQLARMRDWADLGRRRQFSWTEQDEEEAYNADFDRRLADLKATDGYRAIVAQAEPYHRAIRRPTLVRELLERGIPEKDVGPIVDGKLDETVALQVAREWWAGDQRMLVLAGKPGVGKTTAAAWLAAAPPRSALFTSTTALARTSVYDAEKIGPFESASLLVIDDAGVEYMDVKGAFLSMFDALLDERYQSLSKRTVITSNLTSDVFAHRYSERIIDRIRECGRFVNLAGESMRRKP